MGMNRKPGHLWPGFRVLVFVDHLWERATFDG